MTATATPFLPAIDRDTLSSLHLALFLLLRCWKPSRLISTRTIVPQQFSLWPVYFSALMRKTIAKAAVFGSLLFQDTDDTRTIVS
jgi:hypothetical protein